MIRHRLGLLLLSAAVLVPGISGVGFVDRDEGWYAQVAREMLASGDWLVPRYLGEVWLHKPPLLYWLVGASWSVLGVSEWAARLVPVLATAGSVQLAYSLGRMIWSPRAGLYGAAAFVTAGLPAVVGKMLLTDSVLLVCCMGAFVLLWRTATRGVRWPTGLGFWVCVGLAGLAKGPAVVLFVGPLGLALLTARDRRKWIVDRRFWAGLPVAVAVALPWYVYVATQVGEGFTRQFLVYEVWSRLVGAPHGHGGPPGYHLLVSLGGWLPWTALVPGTLLLAWARRREDVDAKILCIWLAVPWIALELIPSKLPHYVLPCYVPIALLLGKAWADAFGRPAALDAVQRAVLRIWIGVPIVLGSAAIGCAVVWRGSWSVALGACGVVLVVAFVAVGKLNRRRPQGAWAVAVAGVVGLHAVGGAWLLPALEPHRLSRTVAAVANALSRPGDHVLACGFREPSMFFYLERPGREASVDDALAALADEDPQVVLIVDPEQRRSIDERSVSAVTWRKVEGLNYVHMERMVVYVGRAEGGSPSGS